MQICYIAQGKSWYIASVLATFRSPLARGKLALLQLNLTQHKARREGSSPGTRAYWKPYFGDVTTSPVSPQTPVHFQ